MKTPIEVPIKKMPKKDPNKENQPIKPVWMTKKKGILTWLKEIGDKVCEGETVCEGEVEKRTIAFEAPCAGILVEKVIGEKEVFKAKDILGYIEKET